ncbi:MAG TPA: PAS domain S-box protein, partial [Candidatus Binatia bacterium]
MKLRSHILIIAGAIIVPMMIVVALSFTWIFQRGRDEQIQQLLSNARTLSATVDRNFEAAQATLRTLATSPHLKSKDLSAFYAEAQRVVAAHEDSEAIILVAPSGRQVINTRRPYGEKLPIFGEPAFIRQIFEQRQPAISNLFRGRIVQRSVTSIGIPVLLNGEAEYVLTLSVAPQFLQQLVAQRNIAAEGIAEILDGDRIIVARSREIDKFLGKASASNGGAERSGSRRGWWLSKSSQGEPNYAAQHRSELSDWTVVVALPKASVDAPLWHAIRNTFGAILVSLVLGLGLALIYGRRIVASIGVLTKGAKALGEGSTFSLDWLPVDELDQVRRELEGAAQVRQLTDQQLRFELQLLTGITNKTAEAIFVTDVNGYVTLVNPEAEKILGFGANELLGEPLVDKLQRHSADGRPVPGSQCTLMAARATENVVRESEEVFFHKDGTSVWVECCAAPLEIDGKSCGAVLIARDITERKRAQQIIDLSERRLAAIMESA